MYFLYKKTPLGEWSILAGQYHQQGRPVVKVRKENQMLFGPKSKYPQMPRPVNRGFFIA